MLRHLTVGIALLGILNTTGCKELKIVTEKSEVRHRNAARMWLQYKRKNKWKDVPSDHKNTIQWASSRDGNIGSGVRIAPEELSVGTHRLSISGEAENPKKKKMEEAKAKNNGEIELTIRNTKPTVSLVSPLGNASFGVGRSITFSVSANDAGEDGALSGASVVWTSSRAPFNLGTGTSVTRSDLDGSQAQTRHTITATATDSGGASRSHSFTVTIVNNPPKVSISSPSTALTVKVMKTVQFTGSAIDPDALGGAASVPSNRLRWSSSIDGFLGDGPSLSRSDLSGGVHTITLRATDANGIAGNASVQVEVLNALPQVSQSQPSKSHYSVIDLVSFQASASDPDGAPLDQDKIVWRSSRDGHLGLGLAPASRTLSTGMHTITVTSTDAHGGVTTKSKTIEIINKNPTVTLLSPKNNESFSVQDEIAFKIRASDPDGVALDDDEIVWRANGDEIGRGKSFKEDELGPGTHRIVVTVTDAHGGTTTASAEIDVINEAPTARITGPNGSVYGVSDSIEFRVTARDPDGTLDQDNIVWRSNKDGRIGRGRRFETDDLTPGSHRITVMVTDVYGSSDSDSVDVRVINHAPSASITSPGNSTYASTKDSITFTASVSDEDDNVADSDIVWSSDRDGELHRGKSFQTDALSPNRHTITLKVTDEFGETAQATVKVLVTNEAPTARIMRPTAGASLKIGETLRLRARGHDDEDGTLPDAAFVWTITKQGGGQGHHDGQGHHNGQGGKSFTGQRKDIPVERMAKRRGFGAFTAVLTVSDSDGATQVVTVNFTLVNEQPKELKLTMSATGPVVEGTAVSFTGSAIDPETGLLDGDNLIWMARKRVPGQQGPGASKPFELGRGMTVTRSDLAPGRYGIRLVAVDPHDSEVRVRSERIMLVVTAKPAPAPAAATTGAADVVNSTGN